MRLINGAACIAASLILSGAALAQTKPGKKAPVKPTPQNQTKGQGQLQGGNGQFGVIYSLKGGFNFEILSAKYTLDAYQAYEGITADMESKTVVLDIAVKNTEKADNFFNIDSMFTLVDEKGQLFTGGALRLMSKFADSSSATLRPGQGLGQPELKDALQIGFKVPLKSRIVKIMVNKARLNRTEEVFRYYVAGATKEEAGEAGDPKNVIQPLPENARDGMDKSGAVGLPEGKGAMATYLPSGYFSMRLDSFSYTTQPSLSEEAVEEGKKFAVAVITVKSDWHKELSLFEVTGGDFPTYEITDADNERYKPAGYKKAKRNEDAEHTFKQGDEYTFRVVFVVPKDVVGKKLVIGTGNSHKWAIDISSIK